MAVCGLDLNHNHSILYCKANALAPPVVSIKLQNRKKCGKGTQPFKTSNTELRWARFNVPPDTL